MNNLKIKLETLKICIQCIGINDKIGCFLIGTETKKQYTKTFNTAIELFSSIKYKELKKTYTIINL